MNELAEMLQDAVEFAMIAHRNQTRKDGVLPFIVHPVKVLTKLHDWGCRDHAVLSAAALHDVVEDTDITVEQIELNFGPEVALWVQELTFVGEDEATPEDKQAYIASFATKSVESLFIKSADRICNVSDYLMYTSAKRARKYLAKANALVETVEIRADEIESRFGVNALHNVLSGFYDLWSRVLKVDSRK